MNVRARLSVLAAVICSALVLAGVAWAAAATTKVTMHGSTSGDVGGSIFSSRKSCLNRLVIAYQQKGSTRIRRSISRRPRPTLRSMAAMPPGTWGTRVPCAPQVLRRGQEDGQLQGRLQQVNLLQVDRATGERIVWVRSHGQPRALTTNTSGRAQPLERGARSSPRCQTATPTSGSAASRGEPRHLTVYDSEPTVTAG